MTHAHVGVVKNTNIAMVSAKQGTTTDTQLYIGLMSGTSLDGVDCVLYDFDAHTLIASQFLAYPTKLVESITQSFKHTSYAHIATLELELTLLYIDAINQVLHSAQCDNTLIRAIGLHGQTVYHDPKIYTKQLGLGNMVALATGITTINDFRTNDILMGGEGAPLTPKYHAYMLQMHNISKASIVNIGGIANVTHITNNHIIGFDTGPGNTLIDQYMQRYFDLAYDAYGETANMGVVIPELLEALLADQYFAQSAPKSTGVEYFNAQWVEQYISPQSNYHPQDIICTLTEVTAHTIAQALDNAQLKYTYICGGGGHNTYLVERIKSLSTCGTIATTQALGMPIDYVEAIAFAYFAKLNVDHMPANIPSVTGATAEVVLGTQHFS